jgi:hypothetical protein
MTYTRFSHDGYEELYPHELIAIVGYIERCDARELERIIREPPKSPYRVKSQGMRDFIADVIAGKKTRPKHKKRSTEREDFEIYLRVRDLRDMNVTRENAEAIVGEEINKPQDTIHKAYSRMQKRYFSKKAK